VSRPFTLRGVIEGFYGPPWSHEARMHAISFLADRGMNAYVYAPKSDAKHREEWRVGYDAAELREFRELADTCRGAHTRFGFAISPGLDIEYGAAGDRDVLLAKLAPLVDAGVDWVVLALDDIPNRAGLAAEQVALVGFLREHLPADVRISLVPTEYVGTRPSPYLTELDLGLPPDVDIFWTGPTVCSPTITEADARAWRAALGGRPLLLWDNYPVNDSVMEHELHLGAYRGREAALADVVDGVLCNPMRQPRASLVPLATAAEFLADPTGYDEVGAWGRAIDAVGGRRAEALHAIARACCDGPLARPETLPLHGLAVSLEAELDGPGWQAPLAKVRDELIALREGAAAWVDDPLGGGTGDAVIDVSDPLGSELAPWLWQARAEAEAGLAALRLLQQVKPVAALDSSGSGRAAAPDAESALAQCFTLLFVWTAAREASHEIVLGPRFGLHAAVVQLDDGRPAIDIALALREDASVIDRLARLALCSYQRWTEHDVEGLRVRLDRDVGVDADADEITLDDDGRFDATPGATVLLDADGSTTRITAPTPPFRDPRLQ
jgi:hyaluronoglucosaminidase